MMGLPDLQWYPKPNGAGDIDGAGAKRLLGQPELDLANLLVRETAQNTWDARRTGRVPEYEVRIRTLTDTNRDVLRWNVFGSTAPESRLRYILEKAEVNALEICDRNTIGLGGSLRNDIDEVGPRDWADFVLAVGAPPDKSSGGGTYGFGKTATYVASRCSTIVIWTVTEHEGELQHRFIASAMDNGFSMDGLRYTGRQWWGRVVNEFEQPVRIEPAVGEDARRLGEAVFERPFRPGETGTSLLIIDPWPPEAEQKFEEWVRRLPEVVVRNLWPKLVEDQPDERKMSISLRKNGRHIPIPTYESATFAALSRALVASRNGGEPASPDPFMRSFTLQSGRPKQLLGHLCLTRFMAPVNDPWSDLQGHVVMMRAPELVVRSQDYSTGPQEGLRWVGVFKPLDELNDAFASSEPPAHDVWEPQSVQDPWHKTFVNVALRQIKERVKDFLTPIKDGSGADAGESTAAVSAALAGLAGTAVGARPSPSGGNQRKKNPSGSGRRPAEHAVSITRVIPLPSTAADLAAGRERSRVEFTVDGPRRCTVEAARLHVAIEGHSLSAGDDVLLESWADGGTSDSAEFDPPASSSCLVTYPAGVAIDIALKVRH